jgi:hypothetical protein
MRVFLALALAACGSAAPTPVAPAPTPAPAPAPQAGVEAELAHGHPTTAMLDELVSQFPTMSAAHRTSLSTIGASQDQPIHVPTIEYEYVWIQKIACNGAPGKVGLQALVTTPNGQLDELTFTCPGDSSQRSAYFDFSDDPQEQQMRKDFGPR